MLSHAPQDAVYAILVNKQDAPGAMNTEELTKLMDLKTCVFSVSTRFLSTLLLAAESLVRSHSQ